jgi:hypothetical protein
MGLMDFLKKKSDTGFDAGGMNFDSNFGSDSGMNSMSGMNNMSTPQPSFGSEFQPEHNMNPMSPSVNLSTMNSSYGQSMMPQGPDISKDLQVISLKLDAIKSELESMNQRIKSLESIAEREQIKSNKKWY